MSSSPDRFALHKISQRLSEIIANGEIAVLVTVVSERPCAGAKLLVEREGPHCGTLEDAALDRAVIDFSSTFLNSNEEIRLFAVSEFAPSLAELSDTQVLFERIEPERRIVVCGAGHVGAALANLASLLGYRVKLIDDRAEFVRREKFPDERIELVAAEDWFAAVREAIADGCGVSVAVVTRGHSEDEACMRAIMTTGADYVGLIGSKRRTRIVLERLKEKGVNPDWLANVHAPIGLDIGAVTPEEVALAIISEIVAVRRGGKGTPLSSKR